MGGSLLDEQLAKRSKPGVINLPLGTVQVFVLVVFFVVTVVVVASRVSRLSVDQISGTPTTQVLLELAIALYLVSWGAGAPLDTFTQAKAYVRVPAPWHIVLLSFGVIASIAAVGLVLFLVERPKTFVDWLLALWLVDHAGLAFLAWLLLPNARRESRRFYDEHGQFARLEFLDDLAEYTYGGWRIARGVAGLAVLLVVVVSTRFIPTTSAFPIDFALAGGALGFVLVFELWIWVLRARLARSWEVLERVGRDYRLDPNPETPVELFVSHAHDDEELAGHFVKALRLQYRVPNGAIRCTSLAGYELNLGQQPRAALRKELSRARLVVALYTPRSAESGWVLLELGAAWLQSDHALFMLGGPLTDDDLPGPFRGTTVTTRLDYGRDLERAVEHVGECIPRWEVIGAPDLRSELDALSKSARSRHPPSEH